MTQHTNPVPVPKEAPETLYVEFRGEPPARQIKHWSSVNPIEGAAVYRLASTPADAPSGEGLHLPWTADPDDRPGYEWNWHVFDAKGDRVCFMANGPDSEAKVRHLVATANTLRTAADPEPAKAQEVEPYVADFLAAVRMSPGRKHPVESYYPADDDNAPASWQVAQNNGWVTCEGSYKWKLTPLGLAVISAADAFEHAQEVVARPLEEWHEDYGDVVWWKFPIDEPAWIGTPLDSHWPGCHTHWTPHPDVPALPQPPADEVKP